MSKYLQMRASALIMIALAFLVYGLMMAVTKVCPGPHPQTPRVQKVDPEAYMYPEIPRVNLPLRQRFMYIIPRSEVGMIRGVKPGRDIYVTYEIVGTVVGTNLEVERLPRIIRFLQAGNTPSSWDEILYIQER